MKGKVKVIRQIENGKKKADVWQEFGVVNSMINVVCKNRRKIIKCIWTELIEHKTILKAWMKWSLLQEV